jgi:hypothetical protein
LPSASTQAPCASTSCELELSQEETALTLRQHHPTAEQREATIGVGAVELGLQTMQKLAYHLGVA